MNNFDINKPFCLREDFPKPDDEKREVILLAKDLKRAYCIAGYFKDDDGVDLLTTWDKYGNCAMDDHYDLVNYVPEPEAKEEDIDWSRVKPGTKFEVRSLRTLPWQIAKFVAFYEGKPWFDQELFENGSLYTYKHFKLAEPEPKEEVVEGWVNVFKGEKGISFGTLSNSLGVSIWRASGNPNLFDRISLKLRKGEGLTSEEKARLK
jgi:hypothetical protein